MRLLEAIISSGTHVTPSGSDSNAPTGVRTDRIAELRKRVERLRLQAKKQFEQGASGLQTATLLTQLMDEFVVRVFEEALPSSPSIADRIKSQTALVAVGGTGRGDLCPYSDVDLLFLHAPNVYALFQPIAAQIQRDLWDAGLTLGASVRTVDESISWARQEPQFATSLVDTRLLSGDPKLLAQLQSKFQKMVVKVRKRQFLTTVVEARDKERKEFGASTQQLEPDIKRSLGGLRDLHLIRWIGFALYNAGDFDSLHLLGAIRIEEGRRLMQAYEFLIGLRFDLHFTAGKEQDLLTREDQLRISRARNVPANQGQSPVERFMQQYFQHSSFVASVARRFVDRSLQKPWGMRTLEFLLSHRIDGIYVVGPEYVNLPVGRIRRAASDTLEGILHLYLTAVRYRRQVAPELAEAIKHEHIKPPGALTDEAAQLFLDLLGTIGTLGTALRSMHENGVLEAVIPCLQHIRCLLQFNQYHHYTVDEHTLKAVEAAESFNDDPGPVGQAYREIHHKELLHLALLLHDAGKGFQEDHSEIGRRLAVETAVRLNLPDHQRDQLVFLVHRHLQMADLALRRNINDPAVLLKFSHEVGSPETLRMLFVLTAADISAVGPGIWNQWKAELTNTLYEHTMLWLSGKSHLFDEETRLKTIKHLVASLIVDKDLPGRIFDGEKSSTDSTIEKLDQFPAHYLLETPAQRIADDFRVVQMMSHDEIHVEAVYDPETETSEYRIITREQLASGCFHKISGVLSAKRLSILSATICTTLDGVIIDAFRARDTDHAGDIPAWRVDEIAKSIRKVLRGETDVETLLKSRGRFAIKASSGPVSNLPTRVVVDNESSDRYSVIDVFAHDRPDLLYSITRVLYEQSFNIVLAKIATHFDQVLDVFFVTDPKGRKVVDGERLKAIRDLLTTQLTEFERSAAEGST